MSPLDNDGCSNWEELIVPAKWHGKRVDLFISAEAPDDLSRARVQALVRRGLVLINDKEPRGTSSKIAEGDRVRFAMPEPDDPAPQPENIPLEVLHEDQSLIVINKPAGMVVHPAPGNWSGTLVNALLHHCDGELPGIGGVRRPGIVHRLDKDTSGVIVVAKSYRAHISLQEQFADHGRNGPLKREYLALVWGAPETMHGRVDAPLGRHPQDRLKRAVVRPEAVDAKPAITHWQVEERFLATDDGGWLASLLRCRLETGRTHQIRVHMAYEGHPLVADPVYGKHFASRANRLPELARQLANGLGRQALHAATLGFAHPESGREMIFSAPVPNDMQTLTTAMRQG